jgi:hypothetical protein
VSEQGSRAGQRFTRTQCGIARREFGYSILLTLIICPPGFGEPDRFVEASHSKEKARSRRANSEASMWTLYLVRLRLVDWRRPAAALLCNRRYEKQSARRDAAPASGPATFSYFARGCFEKSNSVALPLQLGNMRANGARSLDVSCWQCHHRAILSADPWSDDVPVPTFGPRMVCTRCGIISAGALVFEIGQKGLITTALNYDMATFVYRCPTTGMNVQGWFADDPSEYEGEVYETITCVACTRVHLINRSAGRVLGGDDE